MQYRRFEELPVWKDSRRVVGNMYMMLRGNEKLRRDFSLSDQLKRATCSIMFNIAEGFERDSNKQFASYINIAKGSAGEVRAILYVLLDTNYISSESFNKMYADIENISVQLGAFHKFLSTKNN